MAIDKGSLDYKIRVRDDFSKPIQRFRKELLKALSTARFVKQELSKTTVAITNLGVASRKAGTQTKRLTEEERAHWKAVREGAKTAATAQRLRSSARRDQIKEVARIQKQAADALRRVEKERVNTARARAKASRAASAASSRAIRQQRSLNTTLKTTSRSARGLVVTFKRLAGVFVGFQAIRLVTRAFGASITAGVKFNQTVEDTRIGLAGMFATLQQIRDIQTGEILTGATGFAAALRIADTTLEKIRNRSLATAATFTEQATAIVKAIR